MKICKKCNKINLDSATVCKYCGENLESDIPYGFKVVGDLSDDSTKTDTSKSKAKPTEVSAPKSITTPDSSKKVSKSVAATVTMSIPDSTPQTTPYESAESMITVRPYFDGVSVRYANKINEYGGFERIKCPKCGSDKISLVSDTQKKGFSTGNACCGYMLLGPLGFLCGSIGSNKTKTTEYWVCGGCGNHFQSNAGNAEKEKIKRQGMLLSNTPDDVIDNAEEIFNQSSNELNKIKAKYKEIFKQEYLHNKNLKIYAISSLVFVIVLLILAVLLYFVFDTSATVSLILFIVSIIIGIGALAFKSKLEQKFAGAAFIQLKSDVSEATEINNKLKAIVEAKANLAKLRII